MLYKDETDMEKVAYMRDQGERSHSVVHLSLRARLIIRASICATHLGNDRLKQLREMLGMTGTG